MNYDEHYQEEIKRMEWEGGIIRNPEPRLNELQKIINKIRVWLKALKINN